jgi:hypothetical protein
MDTACSLLSDQKFRFEKLKVRDPFGHLVIDGRIILRWILKLLGGRRW